MSGQTDELDRAVADLQTATATIEESIAELHAQTTELSECMGKVADGLSAFDRSRKQLAQVGTDRTGGSPTANARRVSGD